MEAWLPTVANIVLVALIIFYMKQNKLTLEKKVEKVEERLKEDEGDYLTKESHDLLCDNAHLKMEKIFNTQLNLFKDEIFTAIRSVEKAVEEAIKNGHSS